MGQGALCCKFLVAGAGGLECAKLTSLHDQLNDKPSMLAQGDNCDGHPMGEEGV